MDLELSAKVFVVTGASSGIGEATARLLAQEGAFVVAVARDPKPVDGVHDNIAAFAADVTDPGAARRVADAALERYGRYDGAAHRGSNGG
ncbi:SDR family NAD(P)-dependent oxidoreductase [Microbispora amethystogenes]|uniref:SDR family oxidoreductase n=1 Tax=Microbispora amethystogenes TaxID=1427754 RepID=UPI0033E9085F